MAWKFVPRVTATAQTGVEMEALVAVTCAALTVYDMCKALDKGIEITDIHLLEKIRRQERGLPARAREEIAQRAQMSAAPGKTVKLLLADDNPLIRDLISKAIDPYCEVIIAGDGADALLKTIDDPPDLIFCDYNMAGLDGRQLFEKLRGREATRHIPFLFMASRGDIEERLRPLVDGVRGLYRQAIFGEGPGPPAKKVVDRLHLEKMQKTASRPGVIQGRLEEMSMTDLMQSLEMGQKSCRLVVRKGEERAELYFAAGQCRDAKIGTPQGDECRVSRLSAGPTGNLKSISTRAPTARRPRTAPPAC